MYCSPCLTVDENTLLATAEKSGRYHLTTKSHVLICRDMLWYSVVQRPSRHILGYFRENPPSKSLAKTRFKSNQTATKLQHKTPTQQLQRSCEYTDKTKPNETTEWLQCLFTALHKAQLCKRCICYG